MTVTIGINGFGRIGRCTLAHIAEAARNDVQVVKINATGPIETNAHLLKYDSVHGRFGGPVKVAGNTLDLGRGPIEVMSTYNPEELDWDGVDVVLECTGNFNDRDKAAVHLTRGAKRVLVSAPAKRADKTVVYGVNHRQLTAEHLVVSNGSCTTNCLAPLRQGAERRHRHRIRHHDHDPFLHRRPAHAGPPPQGPLPRPRRRHGDDPDLDRRPRRRWARFCRNSRASWTALQCACPRRTSRPWI